VASYAEAVGRGQVLQVGIVAGETSGDRLGGGVVAALRQRCPEISVRGVGGEALAVQGLQSICNMHDISIMGTDGLLGKLRRALAVRQQLYREFVADPPDVFLGIDVPDFNLGLERRLRRTAIPIVHLVSPTVWAWRAYRLRKIRHAVDRMLVLFPFEETWYRERGVAATFVGHPAADETAAIDRDQARAELAIPPGLKIVALLPGSRESEVNRLAPVFLDSARLLLQRHPQLRFIVPFANQEAKNEFFRVLGHAGVPAAVQCIDGDARTVLAASDVALLASGTAALEAALLQCPMVVAYRISAVSFRLAKLLARTRYVSMPNHLVDRPVVPEYLQHEATASNLSRELSEFLDDDGRRCQVRKALGGIANMLRKNANAAVAEQLLQVARHYR